MGLRDLGFRARGPGLGAMGTSSALVSGLGAPGCGLLTTGVLISGLVRDNWCSEMPGLRP